MPPCVLRTGTSYPHSQIYLSTTILEKNPTFKGPKGEESQFKKPRTFKSRVNSMSVLPGRNFMRAEGGQR
jgi:hypothetical protein